MIWFTDVGEIIAVPVSFTSSDGNGEKTSAGKGNDFVQT